MNFRQTWTREIFSRDAGRPLIRVYWPGRAPAVYPAAILPEMLPDLRTAAADVIDNETGELLLYKGRPA